MAYVGVGAKMPGKSDILHRTGPNAVVVLTLTLLVHPYSAVIITWERIWEISIMHDTKGLSFSIKAHISSSLTIIYLLVFSN